MEKKIVYTILRDFNSRSNCTRTLRLFIEYKLCRAGCFYKQEMKESITPFVLRVQGNGNNKCHVLRTLDFNPVWGILIDGKTNSVIPRWSNSQRGTVIETRFSREFKERGQVVERTETLWAQVPRKPTELIWRSALIAFISGPRHV